MRTDVNLAVRRWTPGEYARMAELGILPEAGVELIDGIVREKNAWGTPWRWTYEDFERMGSVVDEDERIELIDGEIVHMTPVGHRHIYTVDLLTEFLAEHARGRAILRVQSPVRLAKDEGPVPDLVLFRMHEDRYRSRQAGPSDALLVVEVADTSVRRDRRKGLRYAWAGIPEYWLVNVSRPVIVVHQEPVAGEYTDIREYSHGALFNSPALGGREVRAEEVLGPGAWPPERPARG
ncbi:Uma2 family endonuclease [Longimicrobium sp.]|jgi:YD repeat-containing protein|uniref:Uma2 family endonuclease n=1 Tax=Longimicrobium sp. TaxID=2029185 RepID=UPI002F9484AC